MATVVNPTNPTLSAHALYFDELDHFRTWLATNQLAQSAQLLFYKLLDLFHRSRWPESIRLSTVRLMALLDCSKSAAYRARQKLAEAGFISFHRGKKGAPASYQFCSSLCHSDCNADSHDNPHSDPHIGPHSDTYGGPYRGTDGGLNPDIHPGILDAKTDAQEPYIAAEKQEEIKEIEHLSADFETACPSPEPAASPYAVPSGGPYDDPYGAPYSDTHPGPHPDGKSPLFPPPTPSPRSPSFPPLLSPQTPFSSPPYYPPTPLPLPPSLSPFFPRNAPPKSSQTLRSLMLPRKKKPENASSFGILTTT